MEKCKKLCQIVDENVVDNLNKELDNMRGGSGSGSGSGVPIREAIDIQPKSTSITRTSGNYVFLASCTVGGSAVKTTYPNGNVSCELQTINVNLAILSTSNPVTTYDEDGQEVIKVYRVVGSAKTISVHGSFNSHASVSATIQYTRKDPDNGDTYESLYLTAQTVIYDNPTVEVSYVTLSGL